MAYVTQIDKVLDHLQSGKKINAKKALRDFKIKNLPVVIGKIRKEGYDVRSDMSDTIVTYYLTDGRKNKWLEKAKNLKYVNR